MARFFVPKENIDAQSITVSGDELVHISCVLRMKVGDTLTLCDGDKTHLRKTRLYAFTLLHFHIGAVFGFLAVTAFGVYGSLALLPLLAWCYVLVSAEDKALTAVKQL